MSQEQRGQGGWAVNYVGDKHPSHSIAEFPDFLHSVLSKNRQNPFRCEGETDRTGGEVQE